MRKELELLHLCLGNCRAVADYLGYCLRHYMAIRRQILSGEAVSKRTQVLIQRKVSELIGRRNFSQIRVQGVATVTVNIKASKTSAKGAASQKEFDKASRKIKSLLVAGKSRMYIHKHLTKAGRITMSYPTFCRVIAKGIEGNPSFLPEQAKR